jgi:hypothetical protein
MPIKELITFAIGVAMAVGLAGGPGKVEANLRAAKVMILREMTRVDNWGTPTPWLYKKSRSFKGAGTRIVH